jgi:DNA polymerase-3 subunit alpha
VEKRWDFQYESAGMKYMKELKPTVFPDLIAMNALYRPGIAYIPSFVKMGKRRLFNLECPEELLKDTYGLPFIERCFVPKLADFSKGDADVLRKAMGRRKDVLIK